jgi:undecaprenyl pyrophosphate synthase
MEERVLSVENQKSVILEHSDIVARRKRRIAKFAKLKFEFLKIYGMECEKCHQDDLKFLMMITKEDMKPHLTKAAYRRAVAVIDKEKYAVRCYNCAYGEE